MTLLILLIAMAILSIQIATDSSIAQELKRILFPIKYIDAFKKLSFWNKLFTKYLLPVNIIFSILFTFYKKLHDALECSRCLSFWLGGVSSFLYGESLLDSLVYGLCTILIVIVIELYNIYIMLIHFYFYNYI